MDMEVTTGQIRRTAFTLLETLVVVAIIALLLSVLLPAVSAVRENVKSLQCASNMRTVTQQFELFVDGDSEAGRGDSERLGPRRFWINDFQEQLYRVDEFWDLGPQSSGQLTSARELMLCPAGVRRLTKTKGWPCGRQSVGPSRDVSLGLNMRLYRAPVAFQGRTLLAPAVTTHVHANILNHPYVPLVLDVDGTEAASRGHTAYYVAPPIDGIADPYASGEYWPGSKRHGGMVNVGFVGGHVLKSRAPELERWDWKYHAEVGR